MYIDGVLWMNLIDFWVVPPFDTRKHFKDSEKLPEFEKISSLRIKNTFNVHVYDIIIMIIFIIILSLYLSHTVFNPTDRFPLVHLRLHIAE